MKVSRLMVALILVLSFSSLAPSLVHASSAAGTHASVDAAKTPKLASLTVDNRTGGVLYVRLSGPKSYSFVATNPGKTTFKDITPGLYSITLTTSACTGALSYTKNIKNKTNLKPVGCHK